MRAISNNPNPTYSLNKNLNKNNIAFVANVSVADVMREANKPSIKTGMLAFFNKTAEVAEKCKTALNKYKQHLSEPHDLPSGKYYGTRIASEFTKFTQGFFGDSSKYVKKYVNELANGDAYSKQVHSKLGRAFEAFGDMGGKLSLANQVLSKTTGKETALSISGCIHGRTSDIPLEKFMQNIQKTFKSLNFAEEAGINKEKATKVLTAINPGNEKLIKLISSTIKDTDEASILIKLATEGKAKAKSLFTENQRLFDLHKNKVTTSAQKIDVDVLKADLKGASDSLRKSIMANVEKAKEHNAKVEHELVEKAFNSFTNNSDDLATIISQKSGKNGLKKEISQLLTQKEKFIDEIINDSGKSHKTSITKSTYNHHEKDAMNMSTQDYLFNYIAPFRKISDILSGAEKSIMVDGKNLNKTQRLDKALTSFLKEYDEALVNVPDFAIKKAAK